MYSHYVDFCQKNSLQPVNPASFGKIIRHTFPSLKTRRLGTRGQSKYHYYGICVKETSPYYDIVYNSARQSSTSFSQTFSKVDIDERTQVSAGKSTQGQSAHLGPSNALNNGVLLPEFPAIDSVVITDETIKEKVKTFLIMYRAHCQRILDTILRANFSEVQNFLLHFWRGMPSHIAVILDSKEVIELIASCDHILYKAISGVLIPGTLQPLPASLTQAIRQFAKQLNHWLEMSLLHLPEILQEKKLSVAKAFTQLLCRQTSLSHLAQAARTVLHSSEPVNQMAADLVEIDIQSIVKQTLWTSTLDIKKEYQIICSFFEEFSQLLEQQATVDQYAEWIASLVNRCVIKPSEKEEASFQTCAQQFLLKWSFVSSKIVQELTLKSAKSFGSFHLLEMLFDDYIFYLIESHAIVSEDTEDSGVERNGTRNKNSDNMDDSSVLPTRPRSLSSGSSGRGSLDSPNAPEGDYLHSQSFLSLPSSLPVENPAHDGQSYHHDEHRPFIGSSMGTSWLRVHQSTDYWIRDQRSINDHSCVSGYHDNAISVNRFHPYRPHYDPNYYGRSLTQELERLHMAYGEEISFDRNYPLDRRYGRPEIRA